MMSRIELEEEKSRIEEKMIKVKKDILELENILKVVVDNNIAMEIKRLIRQLDDQYRIMDERLEKVNEKLLEKVKENERDYGFELSR